MTEKEVLYNLQKLIGTHYNYDEIICAFEDYEEKGISKIIVEKSPDLRLYDYVAYIDTKDSREFFIKVDIMNKITEVWYI